MSEIPLSPPKHKDWRYELIRPMWKEGKILVLPDIFKYVPKTRVATDIGLKIDRMNELLMSPEYFSVRQIFAIAQLVELDEEILLHIFFCYYKEIKKVKLDSYKNIHSDGKNYCKDTGSNSLQ